MTDVTEGESEGTWARLTRRKVVQWGIAYAAGSWGLLQGVQFLAEAFEWPTRVLKLSTFALLVGLPVVLVLAWYHGDRGEQRVGRIELAVVTLLFLLGGVLFWRYQGTTDESSATSTEAAAPLAVATESKPKPTPAADARPSIAVLPFENRSDEHKDVYFVDGMHDDILTQLAKLSAMKVISRTSVERFRDTKLPLKNIAEQLGVTQILEGGVQRAGKRVRITVQLIDAATDTHLWAETYDRELTAANIFAIQSEVATAIAAAMKATLTPAEKARVNVVPTQSLEAWETYQIGKQRQARRTSAGLAEAEKFFRKAIGLDPKFALAYSGLADTLVLRILYGGAPRDATLAVAEKAAATALKLDPNLAEALVSSAGVAEERGQFDRAEQMYRRAIELNPNYATAYQWLSFSSAANGHHEKALRQMERALELDPLSAIINLNVGHYLRGDGRFDEAEARYRKVIEIEPSMPYSYASIGLIDAYLRDRFVDAVPLLEKAVAVDPDSPNSYGLLTDLYLDLGDDVLAARMIEDARKRWPDRWAESGPHNAALLDLYRGEQKKALQAAQKLLALDPQDNFGLLLLRNADLQAGHPDAARARYAKAHPEFVATKPPKLELSNVFNGLDFVIVLQQTGEGDRAEALLDQTEDVIRKMSRIGPDGVIIMDVQILALRGKKRAALAALSAAAKSGWRGPDWRYYRDFDPSLASIRNDPEFKAVFADIERDMARQRAELAARPRDAPLDLGESRK